MVYYCLQCPKRNDSIVLEVDGLYAWPTGFCPSFLNKYIGEYSLYRVSNKD